MLKKAVQIIKGIYTVLFLTSVPGAYLILK